MHTNYSEKELNAKKAVLLAKLSELERFNVSLKQEIRETRVKIEEINAISEKQLKLF